MRLNLQYAYRTLTIGALSSIWVGQINGEINWTVVCGVVLVGSWVLSLEVS